VLKYFEISFYIKILQQLCIVYCGLCIVLSPKVSKFYHLKLAKWSNSIDIYQNLEYNVYIGQQSYYKIYVLCVF